MSMRIERLSAAGLGAGCLWAAATGFAADLRPTLVLPSQREGASPMQQQPAPAPVAQPAGPSDAFYAKFDEDARTMDRARRETLRKDFVKRYDAAKSRNAGAEMKHYQRLLGILATIATERGEAP
ncbi:MAG: hypothetical protein JNL87_13965 [Burkholderiaceae bacterium]|nr:hypothetical protein [Burkholderiaceae bacterium]